MTSRKDLRIKTVRAIRRKRNIRRRIFGTADKPRMSIFRSHSNIYCQVIDDSQGRTLASASTRAKDLAGKMDKTGNRDAAAAVGKHVAEKTLALGIKSVQFDRNGYRFHGRVKALAEAAREAGLKL